MPRTSTLRSKPSAVETAEVFAERYHRQQQQMVIINSNNNSKPNKKRTKRRRRRAKNGPPSTTTTSSRISSHRMVDFSDQTQLQISKSRMISSSEKQGFRPIAPPMPPIEFPELDLNESNAPQVLLWNQSRSRSNTSSSSSSSSNIDGEGGGQEERTSPPNFARLGGVQRQGPSPQEDDTWELGAPRPKWYDLNYWRQKLAINCCLPKQESKDHHDSPRKSTSLTRTVPYRQSKRRLDYRQPAYLQQGSGGYTNNGHGLPYHSFVQGVPMHQLSPLTDATLYGYPHHHQHQHYQQHQYQQHMQKQPPYHWQSNPNPSYYQVPPQPLPQYKHATTLNDKQQQQQQQQQQKRPPSFNPDPNNMYSPIVTTSHQATDILDHGHTDADLPTMAKPKRGHSRSVSSLSGGNVTPPPAKNNMLERTTANNTPLEEQSPIPDYQSVSSLEPGSPWRTPTQPSNQNNLKVIIPDSSQPTMVTPSTSAMSNNRVSGLRRRANTGDCKPPVAPRRRTQSASGQKTPVTASNNNPRVPSPSNNSMSRPRDLDRCFSEASANTSGSRHRRGGTVTEFSFASITNTDAFQKNIPKPAGTPRSTSLPAEVKVHHRPPRTPQQPQQHQPQLHQQDCSWDLGVYDDPEEMYPYCLNVISVSPRYMTSSPVSSVGQEETPDGYISPLEDENHPYGRTVSDSPKDSITEDRRSPTEDTVDFVTGSPQTSEQSNPQDSLRSEQKENVPVGGPQGEEEECLSPFGKLKEPPAIPSGDSWMWKWVNSNSGLASVQEDENALVSTKPAAKPINMMDDDNASVKKPEPSLQQKDPQEYLPKNDSLESQWGSQHGTGEGIALSGWVAFGHGDALIQKLRLQGKPLERSDIGYLLAPNESQTLWVCNQSGDNFSSLNLRGCRCELREVSRQHGRAVVVTRNSTGEAVCSLLPVSLPRSYSGTADEFAVAQPFPKGDYLPDDQQYTTMHVMFSLDALVKANGSWG